MNNLVFRKLGIFIAFVMLFGSTAYSYKTQIDTQGEPPPTIKAVKKFTNNGKVEYDSTGVFIYDGVTLVDRYRAGDFLFEVDTINNQIVQFSPISDENYSLNGIKTINRKLFAPKAVRFVSDLAPEISLDNLKFVTDEENPFAFRWEDEASPKLSNGSAQYVQVVYLPDGRIFSYINTLISSKGYDVNTEIESIMPLYPIYTLAAPGAYFTTSGGTFTYVSSGCYGGSACYVVSGGGSQLGTWTYDMFLRSDVYAYVPNINYTLSDRARYYAYYNDGGSTLTITLCNQQLRKNGYCYLITGKQNFSKAELSCSITAANLYCAYDEVFINNN